MSKIPDDTPPPAKKPPVADPSAEVSGSSLFEVKASDETKEFVLGPATPSQPQTSPASENKAKTFGRYVVKQILGSGAFGTVYLGHDHQLDRAVAIKAHRTDRQHSKDQNQEFLQEARRLAKLKHPGIVAVYDFGVEGDNVYIISDFVQGTTLKDRSRRQALSWQEGVRIVAAIAEALAHAHSHRTVHRDIKPANIILTAEMKPVLVDFGLGLDEAEMTGRQRGVVAGTPAYMSPEQASGQAHRIDGRTDIYSLGVVLYELITGHLPFRSTHTDELLRQVCEDEPQPLRQLVPHIPRGLEQVCLKAMAKRVSDRYTASSDFAEALWKLLPQREALADAELAESIALGTPGEAIAQGSTRTVAPPHESAKTPARPREAERRQLTLLTCHCDLSESADFIENLDIEAQHEILTAYQQLCAGVIQAQGGTVIQATDQNTLACYGFPVAYEDSAARAVRAGLTLLRDVVALKERVQREWRVGFAFSVQVHTGMAVVGDAPQTPGRETLSVVGDARNVIAHLQGVARPDALVISQTTYRLVQGYFICESLGNAVIKGVARPMEFFHVQRENEAQSRIDVAVPSGLSPLIGRDREVGLLQDRWEQAAEGMGQIVLVIGEAGLGKSRLVHVIKEHVTAQSAGAERTIVEWRCTPQHQNSSLYPVVDYFERRLGFERDDSPARKLQKLDEHLQELGAAKDAVAPFLASLLSLPFNATGPSNTLSPVRLKEKTLEAVLEWLRLSATKAPFLLVIEDLHWMDPSTLELLTLHVECGFNDRILTLLTFRPEFETPWKNKAHQTVMALNRLTRKQIADMMQQRTGVRKLPPALVEQIVVKTDGVPLFVEEYTKMVMESDRLKDVDGNVEISASFVSQQIPATLQDLLMARLDRMDSDRDVVQIAAALGREFTYELIRAVTPLEEATLQTELGKLVTAELLYQKGRPPESSYLFKHALIQDAAYLSMLKSKKQLVHRRIVEAIEKQFAELAERQPEVLAHHCTEAGLAPQGIAYWMKAGQRSMEHSANAEAASHLRRGLELLATQPDTPERTGQELTMQIRLGTVLIATQGYAAPEVGSIFARARELCEQIGQPQSLMAVLWGIWAWRVVREEFDICLQLADEAMLFAQAQAEEGIRMEAHFIPALTRFYRGEFTKSLEHCDAGLALYDSERCKAWSHATGQNSAATFRCYRALALWCLGYPDQAQQVGQEGADLAAALKHPFSQCYALHHLGWLQHHLRLGQKVQATAEAEIAIASEQGFAFWRATGTLCKAAGLSLQGKADEAMENLRQGLALYRATGAGLSLAHYHGYFAYTYLLLGQIADALQSVDDALAAAAKNHNDFFLAELHRLKGEILLAQTPDDQIGAEASFQDSLAVALKQRAKSWELRTTMSLCKLWHQQGRHAEARNRLLTALAWFTEGFGTPDLVDATNLLDQWT